VQNADIAALWDCHVFNAGFLVVRPSAVTRRLYEIAREMAKSPATNDQQAVNKAIQMLTLPADDGRALRVNVLDLKRFFSGFYYFDMYGEKIPKICNGGEPQIKSVCPLAVHNNWIIGKQAKIYRFREHLMWKYDGDDQYYTSETRKYLTYTNPKPTAYDSLKNVMERQMSALKTALTIGHLLNRVVILPTFICGMPTAYAQCRLNAIIQIKIFDDHFTGLYRESSFLRHPKVPNSVKQDLADQPSAILTSLADIIRLCSEVNARVLHISNLDRIKIDTNDASFDREFRSKLQSVFQPSRYRHVRRHLDPPQLSIKSQQVLHLLKNVRVIQTVMHE